MSDGMFSHIHAIPNAICSHHLKVSAAAAAAQTHYTDASLWVQLGLCTEAMGAVQVNELTEITGHLRWMPEAEVQRRHELIANVRHIMTFQVRHDLLQAMVATRA